MENEGTHHNKTKGDKSEFDKTKKPKKKKTKDKRKKKKEGRKNGEKSDGSSSSSETSTVKEKKGKGDILADNFVMLNEMGKGAFGQIFLTYNLLDGESVATKKEPKKIGKTSPPQLKMEYLVYKALLHFGNEVHLEFVPDYSGKERITQESIQGVPKFYGYGESSDFFYLIMQLLGPNLIELFNYCNSKKFTIGTVCMMAIQMINRIEYFHKHHYLHRDIKPENFLIGCGGFSNIIYLIDFGLCKKYKDPKTHQHIPYREGRNLTGTARYVSVNTHLGIEQSRRDDLESIGYVLVFFLKGSLPWQGLKTNVDKYNKIMEKKLQIPTEILCYGLPDEITYYLNYCKSLRFEDRPDYDYLRSLFVKLLYTCINTYSISKEMTKFDWCFEDSNTIWNIYNKRKTPQSETRKKIISEEQAITPEEEFEMNPDTPDKLNLLKIKLSGKFDHSSEDIRDDDTPGDPRRSQKPLTNINVPVIRPVDNESEEDDIPTERNEGVKDINKIDDKNLLEAIDFKGPGEDIDLYVNKLLKRKKLKKIFKKNSLKTISENSDKTVKAIQNNNFNNINQYINDYYSNDSVYEIVNKRDKTEENKKKEQDLISNLKVEAKSEAEAEIEIKLKKDSISKEKISNLGIDTGKTPLIKTFEVKYTFKSDGEKNESEITVLKNKKYEEDKEIINDAKKEITKSVVPLSETNKSAYNNNSVHNINNANNANTKLLVNEVVAQISVTNENNNQNSPSKLDKNEVDTNVVTISENPNNLRTNNSQFGRVHSFSANKKEKTITSNFDKELSNMKSISSINSHNTKGDNLHNKLAVNSSNLLTKKSFESNMQVTVSPTGEEKKNTRLHELQASAMKFSKDQLIKISAEPIGHYYTILGDLGHGSYGSVKKVRHKSLGEERAMKMVKKKAESSQNEIEILKKISHPNIISIYEIFEDSKSYYIMTEYLEGGELFEMITSQGFFSEVDAARIIKQILNPVNYLHNKNIVHRDLKPENILLVNTTKKDSKNHDIKLIDFGTAKIFERNSKLTKFIGTSYYIAPEVLAESYDEKCDVWSIGIIFFILLCGYPPFNGASNIDIYHAIKFNAPNFLGEEWKNVNKDAIDLIKLMLNKNPAKRPSAETCLNHKWFKILETGNSKTKNERPNSILAINKMKDFVAQNKLKQAVLQYISTQFNLKENEENLRELFSQFDTNRKGSISINDFTNLLIKIFGEDDGRNTAKSIFNSLDLDGSGEISYNEFITALIDDRNLVTNDRLLKAFQMIDKDKSGSISIDEIKNIFGGDETRWKKVVNEVDLNGDGEIDFEEFKIMMKGFAEQELINP